MDTEEKRGKISGFAIASFVCSLLGIVPFLSLLAIIFGIVALAKIHKNPDLRGMAFAIIGIILGALLAFIWFIGIIAYFGFLSPGNFKPN